MSFVLDKEQIKPGLIIFRRGDVGHDNYYCRIRLHNEDRYKTISLRTADRQTARDRALDEDADIRFRVKHDVPIFNRPFSQVAGEYADAQQRRANAGEVSKARCKNIRSKIDGPLSAYVGSTQIHLITQDRWSEYPLWRRENGEGRRKGVISDSTKRHAMNWQTPRRRQSLAQLTPCRPVCRTPFPALPANLQLRPSKHPWCQNPRFLQRGSCRSVSGTRNGCSASS